MIIDADPKQWGQFAEVLADRVSASIKTGPVSHLAGRQTGEIVAIVILALGEMAQMRAEGEWTPWGQGREN